LGLADVGKGLIANKLGIVSDCIITMIEMPFSFPDPTDQLPSGSPSVPGAPPKVLLPVQGPHMEHQFKLPFNPKEMSIMADVNLETVTSQVGEPPRMSETTTRIPRIILTVPLVFDEMNIADAFTADKFNTATGNIIKNVGTGIAKGLGAEWTIQPVVEGFIGALRNVNTRMVKFNWGDFEFIGIITEFNAEYTMFSPAGNPIRAKATLRLRNDPGADENAWQKEAIEFLGESYNSTKNQLSSVLNIGWQGGINWRDQI
jgi:hypothetical protein